MSGRPPWNKGLTKDVDERLASAGRATSIALLGRPGLPWSDEAKRKQSEAKKRLYKEHPEKHPNRKLAGNRSKMSYPERLAFDWLSKSGLAFEHQFQFGSWFVDFRIDKLLIEIDGAYWHDAEKDALKDEAFKAEGFEIHRIKAKENIEERLSSILGPCDTIRTCDNCVPNAELYQAELHTD